MKHHDTAMQHETTFCQGEVSSVWNKYFIGVNDAPKVMSVN